MQQLLFLEMNEVNLEDVEFYCSRGLLPAFSRLLTSHGWARTTSEANYDELEPWIQWVTAHTGKSLSEHGIYRLGDIVNHEHRQIWEELEDHGLRVGAVSPMNAKHRLRNPAFFLPDPWTKTELSAGRRLQGVYAAISQAVNDNARSRLTARSCGQLALGLLSFARAANYLKYLRLAATGFRAPWRRAILLDLLLADVFVSEVSRTRPNFASLFLNAGAHIQHHYLFSAACYNGSHRNPDWYIRPGIDPVLEVYKIYDRIVATMIESFPKARLMLATGLHQVPHGEITYYWRLRDHVQFLKRIQIPFVGVETRMSRDFLIICESQEQATAAEKRLSSAMAEDGSRLFEVDNRGRDVFVMLTYSREIRSRLTFSIGEDEYALLRDDVAFVALKNGEHSGVGYFLDNGARLGQGRETFPLKEMPTLVRTALGVAGGSLSRHAGVAA